MSRMTKEQVQEKLDAATERANNATIQKAAMCGAIESILNLADEGLMDLDDVIDSVRAAISDSL